MVGYRQTRSFDRLISLYQYVVDLKISLESNDFQFNGETYLQICGAAMGRKYTPSFAIFYGKVGERSIK